MFTILLLINKNEDVECVLLHMSQVRSEYIAGTNGEYIMFQHRQ